MLNYYAAISGFTGSMTVVKANPGSNIQITNPGTYYYYFAFTPKTFKLVNILSNVNMPSVIRILYAFAAGATVRLDILQNGVVVAGSPSTYNLSTGGVVYTLDCVAPNTVLLNPDDDMSVLMTIYTPYTGTNHIIVYTNYSTPAYLWMTPNAVSFTDTASSYTTNYMTADTGGNLVMGGTGSASLVYPGTVGVTGATGINLSGGFINAVGSTLGFTGANQVTIGAGATGFALTSTGAITEVGTTLGYTGTNRVTISAGTTGFSLSSLGAISMTGTNMTIGGSSSATFNLTRGTTDIIRCNQVSIPHPTGMPIANEFGSGDMAVSLYGNSFGFSCNGGFPAFNGQNLQLVNGWQICVPTSTIRLKDDVKDADLVAVAASVDSIKIRDYRWKYSTDTWKSNVPVFLQGTRAIGPIAEELLTVDTRLVSLDEEGLPNGICEQPTLSLVIGALQQTRKELQAERDRVTLLEARIAALETPP
jgi:hypothetical protein